MEMLKVVLFSMVYSMMTLVIITHILDGGINTPMWMSNMINKLYFTWRHSVRSGKWDVIRTYKMAMDVYPMTSERV